MRILIAEDETIIRLDLRQLLERAGYEVVAEAKDGEEAVALARAAGGGEPGVRAAGEGERGGGRRRADGRGGVTEAEQPNAARVRRIFSAFGHDRKASAAAFDRDTMWRVPGDPAMSGEYHGRV